jgi:hypothetical protein
MSGFFEKEPASRVISNQYIQLAAATTSPTTSANFGAETFQIRVAAQMTGWVNIGDKTTTALTSASMFIAATTAGGEYYTVNPGMNLTFVSTTGTSGCINITEMT